MPTGGVAVKKGFWRIQAKIAVLILGAALLVSGFFSVVTIRNLQGNARVINYTGIVRGATQRLVKQELNHVQNDGLIERLDSILHELQTGEGENDLVRLESEEYQSLLVQLNDEWQQLKAAITDFRSGAVPDQLFTLSESYFMLADQSVSAAERYTEQAVQSAKRVLFFINFVFILMALSCAATASVLQKRRERLQAAETETQEKSAYLDQLTQDIRAPLDELSELMYVADPETYDLLFVNNAGRQTFHVDELAGKKCYEVLQGLDAPCPFCSTPKLTPGENYTWEYTNPLTQRHYLLKDRLIQWEGRPARFEIAFDMTESMKEKLELQNMLESEKVIVECIRELYQNHDLPQAISSVLERVGRFLCSERSYIFNLRGSVLKNTYEWCAPGVEPQQDALQNIPRNLFDRWFQVFQRQEYLVIDDLAPLQDTSPGEYEVLSVQHIQRLVVVPLEQNGEVYACVGVDNPPPDRLQNAVSILQTVRYFLMLATKRSEDEAALAKLSYYDTLTSFFNRNRYMQDLGDLAAQDAPVGIVYLDVNGLKDVNDHQGHDAGDRLLVECAQCIREDFGDFALYRIGGDEFVVIAAGAGKEEFFDKVRQLRYRFDQSPTCRVAIGAHWAQQGSGIRAAITAADEKMYSDKQAYYHANPVSRRYRYRNDDILYLTAVNTLRAELDKGRFVVFLQPKFAIAGRRVVGAEALVRYRDDRGKLVMPDSFIPLLEESKTIGLVDFFVFETVCSMLRSWHEEGRKCLPISVNFSRRSLMVPQFTERLITLCKRYDVPTANLEIEITENVSGVDSSDVQVLIDQIRRAGFSVSIDDFGMKFSNLSLFSAVNFDTLKIDRSLVWDITSNRKAQAIISAMVGVCKKMDIQLVAEGVEEETQLTALSACGVELVQGFLFSGPVPAEEYESRYLENC